MTKSKEKYAGYCTCCRLDIKSFAGLEKCPKCGTETVPCSYKNEVNIKINWHELRILTVYAENWLREVLST